MSVSCAAVLETPCTPSAIIERHPQCDYLSSGERSRSFVFVAASHLAISLTQCGGDLLFTTLQKERRALPLPNYQVNTGL